MLWIFYDVSLCLGNMPCLRVSFYFYKVMLNFYNVAFWVFSDIYFNYFSFATFEHRFFFIVFVCEPEFILIHISIFSYDSPLF